MQLTSNDPQTTRNLGSKLAGKLMSGGVVALEGGLGGGKTVFVKGLAKGLGIKAPILSPSFTIYRSYKVPGSDKRFHHFDFYRLDRPDEEVLGELAEYIEAGDIVAVEWAEKVRKFLPRKLTLVKFEVTDLHSRNIEIKGAYT